MLAAVSWWPIRRTPLVFAYAARPTRSKSGYGSVKLNVSPFANQSPSQPLYQPSTRTPRKPFAAAKSMYRFVSAVVAPCFGPELHVFWPRCMPHQIPTYLYGFTHDTSPRLFGSLRFRSRLDS